MRVHACFLLTRMSSERSSNKNPYLSRNQCASAGECVPLRVFLKPYPLTPTYRATNKFTVKYFLNLVLVDEEDRR